MKLGGYHLEYTAFIYQLKLTLPKPGNPGAFMSPGMERTEKEFFFFF